MGCAQAECAFWASLGKAFYPPKQWESPGNSCIIPQPQEENRPRLIEAEASGLRVCVSQRDLPAPLPSLPRPEPQAVFLGTVPWYWLKLFPLNAGWGKDIA